MNFITKHFKKTTPKERAAEHLYQAEMDLLDACRAQEHYAATVNALKITIARLKGDGRAVNAVPSAEVNHGIHRATRG